MDGRDHTVPWSWFALMFLSPWTFLLPLSYHRVRPQLESIQIDSFYGFYGFYD